MSAYIQVGVTALRDPVTGEYLPAVPLYIREEDRGKVHGPIPAEDSETAPVWVKTGSRTRKGGITKYECIQYEDVNHYNSFKFDKVVFVGFTY